MKHRIEIFVAILSASAMLFSGCGKVGVSDSTEGNSLKKSIISTIDRHVEKIEGQIASFGDELASMRDSDKYQEEDIRVLEEKLSTLSKELSDIKNSVSRLEDSDSDFTEKVDEVNSRLEALDAEIESLRAMIVKLKEDAADAGGGDVEKIIYVPKYEDRPDSLHYHLDGLKILGDITLKFLTQPQEAAMSIAEHWQTALSAHAIYDGDEFDLTITGTSVNDSGILSISISADSLPRNFIEGSGCVDVEILYGEKPISSSIRVGAVADESAVLTMLSQFDRDGDGQVVDDLNEETEFRISESQELSPYFNLLLAAMPALTYLECRNMDLTSLDLSNNPALAVLDCSGNNLTTLDLSKNTSLASLDVSNNTALASLDYNEGLKITTGFSVGHHIQANGVSGVAFYISGAVTKIVSTDETSATWENAKIWCADKSPAWYMPSLDELTLIYDNKTKLNSTLSSIGATQFSSVFYWSSTEYSRSYANGLYFRSGNSGNYSKDNSERVRAVRAL